MARYLPILVGMVLILVAAALHGAWTERWRRSPELEQACARMADLPDEIDGWKSEPIEQDAGTLKVAGALAYWGRRFHDPEGGQTVQVFLLCGRPGQMAVHKPEDCYLAAGFVVPAGATRLDFRSKTGARAELRTGVFAKEEAVELLRLRIFWSWGADGIWQAPEAPRWAFAKHRALYKLYVVREGPEEGPCLSFLELLLPRINKALFPEPAPAEGNAAPAPAPAPVLAP